MVMPDMFNIGDKVNCQGRSMWVVGRQRGGRYDSKNAWGVYYDMAHTKDGKAVFTVHQSQLWPLVEEHPAETVRLVKS